MSAHTFSRVCHLNLARGFRGGERQTELIIRALARLGATQQAVVRRGQPLAARLRDVPGLQVDEIGKPWLASYRLMRGALLHVHTGNAASPAYSMHKLFDTPYVITRRVDARPGNNPLTRARYRRAAGIVAISQAIADGLRDYLPGLKPVIIPSAHADLRADAQSATWLQQTWGGGLVIGQVGALVDRHKGQSLLIDAARQLRYAHPDWRFVLVGDGPDEAWLRERAAGLENLVFTGHVDNVGDYLAAFDLFAMPSRYEGLGSSLIDAMAFGLPSVASRVGGIPELLRDGIEGRLVVPDSADALARALRELGENEDFRTAAARAARDRANAFAPDRLGERYLAFYHALGFDPVRA